MSSINRKEFDNQPNLSGGHLVKNSFLNLFGHGLPMIVAFFTMPFIIEGLGTERFGVLTLAWMVVGYFSLFDLGLGRATTKFVAEFSASGDSEHTADLIWASIYMILGFSVFGVIIAILFTPYLVNNILNIEPGVIDEAISSFYLLAGSIPIVLGTTSMRGILEAHQKFKIINAIKIPTYIAAFVTPLLVLPFTNNLLAVVILLVLSRLAALIAYTIYSFKIVPGLGRIRSPRKALMKKLITYGGWLTASNVIWPFMNYLDRFIIGAMLTMTMVAYYVTPYELVTKLLVISGSLLAVMFPAFSALSVGQYQKFMELQQKAVKYMILILTPVVFVLIASAKPFFSLWLGEVFVENSSVILQLLGLGILLNSISQVFSSAIQAMNRPDIPAKLHMIEFPLYLGMLYYFIHAFGIVGAAFAWLLRIVLDSSLYFYLYYRLIPLEQEFHIKPEPKFIAWGIALVICGFGISAFQSYIYIFATIPIVLIGALLIVWKQFLKDDEQNYIKTILLNLTGRKKAPQC